MKQAFFLSRKQLHVVILVSPKAKVLELSSISAVFHAANRLLANEIPYAVTFLSVAEDQTLQGDDGLRVLTECGYQVYNGEVDTLILVGTGSCDLPQSTPPLRAWVRQRSHTSRRVVGIGAGALTLAEAGLLNGRRATTHRELSGQMARLYPQIHVEPNVLFVRDANFYTSAGAASSIDLALSLVQEDCGNTLATEIARELLLVCRRTGHQPQLSATLAAQKRGPSLCDLLAWMADNVHEDINVTTLAQRVAMSPRNFARIFAKEVGTTPGKHMKALRLEVACRELEASGKRLTEVAGASGFSNVETFRRAFTANLGVTPGEYRASVRSQEGGSSHP